MACLCYDLYGGCRLNDWNMPGNEGLCSWPTTPVHDPFDRVAASLHESQGHTLAWNPRSAGTLRSMAKDGQADRLVITSVGGEHLILA